MTGRSILSCVTKGSSEYYDAEFARKMEQYTNRLDPFGREDGKQGVSGTRKDEMIGGRRMNERNGKLFP